MLEESHTRELRHDFRAIYHVAYEDVDTVEAIDLIHTLPQGSAYRGAAHVEDSWTCEQHALADIEDWVRTVSWQLAHFPEQEQPTHKTRPYELVARSETSGKSRRANEILKNTKWGEAG